jgi:hypothetical protein
VLLAAQGRGTDATARGETVCSSEEKPICSKTGVTADSTVAAHFARQSLFSGAGSGLLCGLQQL